MKANKTQKAISNHYPFIKTKVVFLYNDDKESSDIFAFFPEQQYGIGAAHFDSYAHIGQHGACDIDYARESRKATPDEYKDLKTELESIGYNLEILEDLP